MLELTLECPTIQARSVRALRVTQVEVPVEIVLEPSVEFRNAGVAQNDVIVVRPANRDARSKWLAGSRSLVDRSREIRPLRQHGLQGDVIEAQRGGVALPALAGGVAESGHTCLESKRFAGGVHQVPLSAFRESGHERRFI